MAALTKRFGFDDWDQDATVADAARKHRAMGVVDASQWKSAATVADDDNAAMARRRAGSVERASGRRRRHRAGVASMAWRTTR